MKKLVFNFLLLTLPWLFSACSPIFSDMQSARLVGKNKFEVTPGFGSTGSVNQQEVKSVGLQTAYGLSDRVDFRMRLEYSWWRSTSGDIDFSADWVTVAFGPKISLIKDRMALYMPLFTPLGGIFETQPTLLITAPLVPGKVDFNPSVKHIATFCEQCWEPVFAFNFGMAISSDLSKWAIRPEWGVLYNFEGSDRLANFSIGTSFNISALRNKKM